MANYCDNIVELYGKKKDIEKLYKDATKDSYDLIVNGNIEIIERFENNGRNKVIKKVKLEEGLDDIGDKIYVYKFTLDNKDKRFQILNVIDDVNSKYFLDNSWYKKRIDRFGTKWIPRDGGIFSTDFSEIEIAEDDSYISASISFETPWSPGLGISKEISKKYNLEVDHYYEERGIFFAGEVKFIDGDNISNEDKTEELKNAIYE